MCKSALITFQTNSSWNTIPSRMPTMDGSTMKLQKDAMVSPRPVCWPTHYSACALIKLANIKPSPRLGFGATSGTPLCLYSLLTTSELSMFVTTNLNTYEQPSLTITRSQRTLRGKMFWYQPQIELRNKPRPMHISPFCGWLHCQPAPQIWTLGTHQTTNLPAPPPRNYALHQSTVRGIRGHHPQTHRRRNKPCASYSWRALILCARGQQQTPCGS